MRLHKHYDRDAHDQPSRYRGLDLWFYEQRGSRYYLRLTRIGLAVMIVPTVLAVIAITALFFYRNSTPVEKPDININVQSTPDYVPNRTLLKRAPPPPPPPQVRSPPNVNTNSPLVITTPGNNTNEP